VPSIEVERTKALGLHPEYGPGYFAAFIRDPDGHRLEAVLHEIVS
jgi:hypothetical protein